MRSTLRWLICTLRNPSRVSKSNPTGSTLRILVNQNSKSKDLRRVCTLRILVNQNSKSNPLSNKEYT